MRDIATSWRASMTFGVLTLILGIVVAFNPAASINLIAVLVGLLLLVSGALELIQALDTSSDARAWNVVIGLALVLVGIILIRHLHVTKVLIALLVGVMWIGRAVIQLMSLANEEDSASRRWRMVTSVIMLVAGVVVIAVPVGSLNALAILLGLWFIVIGLLDIGTGFVLRRTARTHPASPTHT